MENTAMITEVCAQVKNWFDKGDNGYINRLEGRFEVVGGELVGLPSSFNTGQYVRIIGSVFNDGVHLLPVCGLVDEVFFGAVFALVIPKDFVNLCEQIGNWVNKNPESAFVSESFGGWSGTRATGSGGVVSWQEVFKTRLNRWRKI